MPFEFKPELDTFTVVVTLFAVVVIWASAKLFLLVTRNFMRGLRTADLDTVERILRRNEKPLMSLPNVVGVSLGKKIKNGTPTDETAISVLVSEKVEQSELSADQRVPASIEGMPTDVVEVKL